MGGGQAIRHGGGGGGCTGDPVCYREKREPAWRPHHTHKERRYEN